MKICASKMIANTRFLLILLEFGLVALVVHVNGQSECKFQDGKCMYNINLLPPGNCFQPKSTKTSKIEIETAPEAIKQRDEAKMYKMQEDLDVVKSDHENRIKELEQSIQKLLRNVIPTGPMDYGRSSVVIDKRPQDLKSAKKETEMRRQSSEDTLLMQLQSQFNRLRSSLSTRTADLLETKNKLNETSDLLKETQRQLFTTSNQLAVYETKATVLEREGNIMKNKLKHKTEKLEFTEEKLNRSENKLVSLENQLYDLVRTEATLREEFETVKYKLNKTLSELEELRSNHSTLTKKYHRTKKTLHFREEELMDCYTGKIKPVSLILLDSWTDPEGGGVEGLDPPPEKSQK